MAFDLDKWVVPHVLKAAEYSMTLGEIAHHNPDYARLCLNENPLPPSEKVLAALLEGGRAGNRYPDRRLALRAKIGSRYGLTAENVFLANGSSETIDSMMRAFLQPGDEILLPSPTFSLFDVRATVVGGTIVRVPFVGSSVEYSLTEYLNRITDRTRLILVVTPNNPTGSFFPKDDLRRLLDRGIPTCIDEAYVEFHPEAGSHVDLLADYPNAFVSRTMSKAYGLAGFRFGYLFGSPAMVHIFERLSLPWNFSFPAVLAAEAAFDDTETLARNIDYNNLWISRFEQAAVECGLSVVHPAGNFIMIDVSHSGMTEKEIFNRGVAAGVVVKTVGAIGDRKVFFRLTPGSVADNERAIAWMKQTFGR